MSEYEKEPELEPTEKHLIGIIIIAIFIFFTFKSCKTGSTGPQVAPLVKEERTTSTGLRGHP
jgi:hypothetical protein